MTYEGIQLKLHDHPFKPFRIKMVNNTVYDIWEPSMISPGDTSAVVVSQSEVDERGFRVAKEWRTISISHILEFSELNVKENGRHKRKK